MFIAALAESSFDTKNREWRFREKRIIQVMARDTFRKPLSCPGESKLGLEGK